MAFKCIQSLLESLLCIRKPRREPVYDEDFYTDIFKVKPRKHCATPPNKPSLFAAPQRLSTENPFQCKKHIKFSPTLDVLDENSHQYPPVVWIDTAHPSVQTPMVRAPAWSEERVRHVPSASPAQKLQNVSIHASCLKEYAIEITMAGTLHVMDALI